jgi:hypothetical protein
MRNLALWEGLLSVDQALTMSGGIQALLITPSAEIFDCSRGAYLPIQFFLLARYWPGQNEIERASRALDEMNSVGQYLTRNPQLPWVTTTVDAWHPIDWGTGERTAKESEQIDPVTYFGAAAIALIMAEIDPKSATAILTNRDPQMRMELGTFKALETYIKHRQARKSGQSLPELPVPEEFKQVFRDWAEGKVNFVGPAAGPEG